LQLYYETRVKKVVADAWPVERNCILAQKENGEDVKNAPEAAPLWFHNKITQAEFLLESDAVKEEVE
jgi:hypothetical protein